MEVCCQFFVLPVVFVPPKRVYFFVLTCFRIRHSYFIFKSSNRISGYMYPIYSVLLEINLFLSCSNKFKCYIVSSLLLGDDLQVESIQIKYAGWGVTSCKFSGSKLYLHYNCSIFFSASNFTRQMSLALKTYLFIIYADLSLTAYADVIS